MICTVDSANASIFCLVLFCVLLPQDVNTWLFDDLTVNNKRLLAQSKTVDTDIFVMNPKWRYKIGQWPHSIYILMFSIDLGQTSIFGGAFFVSKSLLAIERQKKL